MPTYVYGCDADKTHERQEIVHRMSETPVICCPTCGGPTHRIPMGGMAVTFNAFEVMTSWMNENYIRCRARRPRFSPHLCKRADKPLPATQAHTRKRKGTTK